MMPSNRPVLHARKHFAPIGSFVSAAPRARLLAVLRQLKPQLNLRLRTGARERDGQRYDVDVDIRDLQVRHVIDPWLDIKCALAAAFPENEPDGIRRLQP